MYTRKIILQICLAFLILLPQTYAQNKNYKTKNWKLRVSANHRFLQHENGKPFFWLGDTGWLLFTKLNREEAVKYLSNRAKKGFNVIQAMVIHSFPAINIYGDSAFVNDDPTKPKVTPGSNPDDPVQYDYWDNVNYIIDEAAKKGIYMALVPIWGSNVKDKKINMSNAAIYAAWLANRYKDKPNIIWINGGDAKGGNNYDVWNTIGKTIRKNDPNHLITFHPFGRTQSSTWFQKAKWLDFNMFQSGHRRYDQDPGGYGEDNWRYVQSDYNKLPVKPTLDGEPSYEGIPQGLHDTTQPRWQSRDVRRYAYWSVFAGACGFTYGDNSVMQFHKPTDKTSAYGAKEYWFNAINDTGATQMIYLKRLMLAFPYFSRVPDQSIIAGKVGTRYDRLIATRGDGYLFVYDYSGRRMKINMGKISGRNVNAYWYNPRNGNSNFIGEFLNTGVKEFNPPGKKRYGNDWVLIICNASMKFPLK